MLVRSFVCLLGVNSLKTAALRIYVGRGHFYSSKFSVSVNCRYLIVTLKVRLFFQAVHEVLEDLLRDGCHAITAALVIHDVEPDVVLFVYVILHLFIQLLH